LIDFEFFAALNRHGAVPKAAPAGVQPAQHPPFQTTMGLLGELLDVKRIHQAMHGHQHVGLFVLGVDVLGNGNEADPGKFQPLDDPQGVGEISRKPAGIIDQNHVEVALGRERGFKQTVQPWTIRADTRNRFIPVDVLLDDLPTVGLGKLLALSELVFRRRLGLFSRGNS